ncbi:hypothetical protein GIB67_004294 [Kingdonia uniflora]|uniref:Protein kinase domain-containing protein n=1 Tax=Kingdonia uniflora TaxID=39325 RepID=A0A7J7MR57_9MAGN|nr:hypothetical protein GIB67_004294 [Kingdonia uniflora]
MASKVGFKYPNTLLALIFMLIMSFTVSQPIDILPGCVLTIPTISGIQNCEMASWGGFLPDNCCGGDFNAYLEALGQQASLTGQIYLNSTELRNCLDTLKVIGSGAVLSCGLERLTRGGGGCSDFSVDDVVDKLVDESKSLGEHCNLLGSEGNRERSCGTCSRSWEEIGKLLSNNKEFGKPEIDICRFTVLVSLISKRIKDTNWTGEILTCLGEQSIPTQYKEPNTVVKMKGIRTGLWIVIGSLVATAIIAAVITTWIVLRRRSKPSLSPKKEVTRELLPQDPGCQKISIKDIYTATDNLSALNFIGQGIAGKVYKGVLQNGRKVAVKHIVNDLHMETFVREVTSLSHVKHPNLVILLGYCEKEDECFLVYELCPNGNLSEWLFGQEKILSWIQRLEIAIDSARGLWFLHTFPEGCIVHRDIKPTNILLGTTFEAKLSDFGLSKVMDLGQSYVSSEVRGTFGYVDPEYQQNHHVNSSGDVYSFGIVLLQLLSGRRVINLNLTKPMPLDKMAKFLTRGGNIAEFADPKLIGEYSAKAFDLMLELALSCTSHKQQRPPMEQVVRRLENALDISTRDKVTSPPLTPMRVSSVLNTIF